MNFEYNSHLEFEERVLLVSKEIKKAYPFISNSSIIEAAALSNPIDDHVTNDEKFHRLYLLLLVLDENKEDSTIVFNDIYNLYEDGLKEKKYNDIMEELVKYYSGNRSTFPLISEVM